MCRGFRRISFGWMWVCSCALICAGINTHMLRLQQYMARFIFFVSWTTYPIYFVLGFQGSCTLTEPVLEVLHIISDAFAKNLFGILMWNTLWKLNDGNWESTLNHFKPVSLWEPVPADTPPALKGHVQSTRSIRGHAGSKRKVNTAPIRLSKMSTRSDILLPRQVDSSAPPG